MPLVDGISRKQLQTLAIETLIGANTAAYERVTEPMPWPTKPEMFPLLLVQTPVERKSSLGRGIPQFNTVITLVVVGRVMGESPEQINADLDELSGQVEEALLCTNAFVNNLQQFITVETQSVVTSDSKYHIGEFGLKMECEVYQAFGPGGGVPLVGVKGTITSNGETLTTVNVTLPITS